MSHLDQAVDYPISLPRALLVLLIVATLAVASCDYAYADEPAAPRVRAALYAWKLAVLDHDGTAYRRGGDLWGGRAIASVELSGGLHLGLRGDASALSADFDLKNPTTWRSIETYAALSRPFDLGKGWTGGPAVMAGALMPITTEASWSSEPTYAGGMRVGRGTSWAYALAGPNGAADQRAPLAGHPVRFITAAQLEFKRFALVGDWVSGPGGFARGGLAFRVPTF